MTAPPQTDPATPYWRLSGFYFFYFASLGVLVPYWPLYLKSLGFTPSAIGELMALVMATKIIAPNVWGWIADHTGRRMMIVRGGSLLAVLCFAGVFFGQHYWWMVMVMGAFSFFWNATLPQFEATTFTHLGENSHQYSSIRLWGSIGFVIAVAILGTALEDRGAGIVPVFLIALFAGIWLISLIVPERAAGHLQLDKDSIFKVIRRPEVGALIVVVFLMQASHGPFYTFYSIYLEDHGYSKIWIGWLWALGVIAEIVVFMFMHRLIPRFGLRKLLMFSLLVAAVRWLLLGEYVDSLGMMLFVQVCHAATFGIFHAVSIHYFHLHFTGAHQGRGQALYSSMSFGAGGALGALLGGYAWTSLGPGMTYNIAALLAALAIVISWRFIREPLVAA
ncbi:MFS transporter [Sulfuriflexus sp.]|uniref:MFS transporter n=1 Tax=Sulfuriflexus sp. TaxID=2015443 RepID=UPI0028CC6FAC|nr:MFS transporter [Sulfuriflexus sp.]MDT8404360.1 MFS transporter [Sulfuriflexus sp.]